MMQDDDATAWLHILSWPLGQNSQKHKHGTKIDIYSEHCEKHFPQIKVTGNMTAYTNKKILNMQHVIRNVSLRLVGT